MMETDSVIDAEFKARAQRILDRINWALNDDYERRFGREPRYRYFAGPNGEMYCWTVERLSCEVAERDCEELSHQKYAAFEYRPTGPGARTGKATEWKKVRELHFAHRNTAKARALKWYTAARDVALRKEA